jgi:hypothetical protein
VFHGAASRKDGFMGTATAAATCLLTPRADKLNRFDAKPGMLTLNVKDIDGSTNLDTRNSTVRDITDSALPVAVPHTCTQSSLSFQVEAGKAYLITLGFVQLTSPNATVAELREGGQQIDIIDMKNLSAGYVVYA